MKTNVRLREAKAALIATIPVMTGYIVMGIGFGVMLSTKGYGVLWATVMAVTMYAGSMQYAAVELLANGVSVATAVITTLLINARHLFYGISLIDRYRGAGLKKIYMMFALTDETYSLVCSEDPNEPKTHSYHFLISLFNQLYWITGCTLGAVIGTTLDFNTEGIDFALTALFITIFVEQWLSTKRHLPAIIGLVASVLSLMLFGSEDFLIPSMILIAIALTCIRGKEEKYHG